MTISLMISLHTRVPCCAGLLVRISFSAAASWQGLWCKADGVLPEVAKVRSSKYLNNRIEQDHRNIKSRTNAMVGFKRFRSAATTISGIELMHRIRKGQFDLAKLGLKDTAAPAVWNAVLSVR